MVLMDMHRLPVYWDGQSIIVNNSVRVDPPYGLEDCKAPKDKQAALVHLRAVLSGYYKDKAEKEKAAGYKINSAGGANRPVMPAVPRKGG
jgi:hypothetical protein